jgi:hypothetical protein
VLVQISNKLALVDLLVELLVELLVAPNLVHEIRLGGVSRYNHLTGTSVHKSTTTNQKPCWRTTRVFNQLQSQISNLFHKYISWSQVGWSLVAG